MRRKTPQLLTCRVRVDSLQKGAYGHPRPFLLSQRVPVV